MRSLAWAVARSPRSLAQSPRFEETGSRKWFAQTWIIEFDMPTVKLSMRRVAKRPTSPLGAPQLGRITICRGRAAESQARSGGALWGWLGAITCRVRVSHADAPYVRTARYSNRGGTTRSRIAAGCSSSRCRSDTQGPTVHCDGPTQ